MREEQLIEVNFLMGEWMPILELSAKLREEQSSAEDESDSDRVASAQPDVVASAKQR